MWVKVLKYAAQAAISAGLHKKVGAWLKQKALAAALAKLEKAEEKVVVAHAEAIKVTELIEGEGK